MLDLRSLAKYILVLLCLSCVSICHAISFGEIKVYSYLDEPLSAELELTDLNGVDPNSIYVSLGSANDFVRSNIPRPFLLTNISFDVVTYQDRIFVAIRSSKVVKTPFLEFLINFSWPNGDFIKEYTILLDPPPSNVSNATRPVPYSTLADKQAAQKLFPSDVRQIQQQQQKAKQMQMQSTAQAQLKQVQAQVEANTPLPPPPEPTPEPVFDEAALYQQQLIRAAAAKAAKNVAPDQSAAVVESPSKTQFQKSIDQQQIVASQPQANQNISMLESAIEVVKDIDTMVGTDVDLKRLSAERKRHLEMYKDVPVTGYEPDIDFGDVIKSVNKAPSGVNTRPGAPSALMNGVAPGIPNGFPTATPPPRNTGGGIMLLLVGFLLGIVGVISIGLKQGWHKKLLARYTEPQIIVAPVHNPAENDIDMDFDVDLEDELGHETDTDIHEHINLHAVEPKNDAIENLNLDDFEKELSSLSVDKLNDPGINKPRKITSKTMHDLLNIETEDLTAMEIPDVKVVIKPDKKTPKPQKVVQSENIIQSIAIPSKSEPEPVKSESIDLEDLTFDLKLNPEDEDVITVPPIQNELTINDDLVTTESLTIKEEPNIDAELALNIETDLEHKVAKSHKRELRLADEPVTTKVEPVEQLPGLTLEPEGAQLISAEEQAVKLKIELAKKYLDAGDKETARTILQEVIDSAEDGQKLEAEIILSGII